MASTGDDSSADPMMGSADCMWGSEAIRLAAGHDLFAVLLDRNGPPPDWRRPNRFDTFVRLILEQQVSLASANAAFTRLMDRVGDVTPSSILSSSDDELKSDGFSRQKIGYVRGIAMALDDGSLDLENLVRRPSMAPERLLELRGIGPWTVACYSLFVLGDPDVWPTGDRALYVSLSRNLGRSSTVEAKEGDAIAARWAPHRSTAARMLWHDYLGGTGYVPDERAGFL